MGTFARLLDVSRDQGWRHRRRRGVVAVAGLAIAGAVAVLVSSGISGPQLAACADAGRAVAGPLVGGGPTVAFANPWQPVGPVLSADAACETGRATPSMGLARGEALDPLITLEDFRHGWNETAALSPESDPLGIWRFRVARGGDTASIAWPERGLELVVAIDAATTAVREASLTIVAGDGDRVAFVHGMAVLITVATPRLDLEQRVAVYTRLAEASEATRGGAFQTSIVADGVRLTLAADGRGDTTVTVSRQVEDEPSGNST